MEKDTDAKRGGFTLIELLVVIAIISILAGLLLGVVMTAPDRARRAVAGTQLKGLEVAIRQYDFDFGQYPPDTAAAARGEIDAGLDLSSECLVEFLGTAYRRRPNPAKGEVQSSRNCGPYFEFPEDSLVDRDGDGRLEFVDPWGRPYEYDNVRDDPAGYTACDTTAPDPRAGKAHNLQWYDVFCMGAAEGSVLARVIANFRLP